MLGIGGGRFFWAPNEVSPKFRGIVVIFAWASIQDSQLNDYVNLYSSLGWKSLVCVADFLNPFFPDRAISLAFAVLCELVEKLRIRPCPVVLAAYSGGSKACMYKVFQILDGACEAQLNLADTRLVRNCISGHIYDSSPVDFTSDLGARFALHPTVLRVPGSAKVVSAVAKGVASGLDALFITRFGSQSSEYWQTLYSSVSLGAPFLILCSKIDDFTPYSTILDFAQRLQSRGGSVKLVKWSGSSHLGHFKHDPIQYVAAVNELLEQAVSIHSQKIQHIREGISMEGVHDEISELICDLRSAAVNSTQSFGRIARGPDDHFFLPSSAPYNNNDTEEETTRSLQEEAKEKSGLYPNPPSLNAHSILGQILFDACVPKNIEGWDIKFSGSLNRQPFASARKTSPLNIKCIRRSRL